MFPTTVTYTEIASAGAPKVIGCALPKPEKISTGDDSTLQNIGEQTKNQDEKINKLMNYTTLLQHMQNLL